MEENNKRYLLLIPKGNENNTGKSKEFLEKITTKEEEGEVVIHHFSSLSLKVLNKLCFKELNQSFIGEVLKELRISSPNKSYFTIKKGFINLKRFDALIKEQSSLIEFFQDVLKSSFAKNYLDIRNFGGLDEVLKKNYQQIELFESDLEKACYIKKEVFLTKQEKENFLTNFNISVFEISSYDLRIKNENRKEIVTHHRDKVHTERWLDLWKRNANNKNYDYTTRLHHEINITYREADEKLKKKIRKSTLLPCYRNRFGKDQFTLSTTIFLNSTAAKSELSFSQDENFEKKIADFNKEFNTSHNEVFTRSYRINRGEKEMATLCVTKSKNPLQEFLKFETYILKDEEIEKEITRLDGTKTKKKVIDNISYFIDDETLFYKNDTGYIDLAQAKLIKGKIVQNGDQNTYLKLKELLAKRRLFELFANENIDNNSKIEIDKSIYVTDKNNIKIPIYWLTEEQRYSQKIKQKLELTLKVYLQTLEIKNKHESIETLIKINHLRDAITANIVGIVHYLQKQFPGEIYIEHKNTKEEKLSLLESANEDISRNLEWALYRKLQESGLVPPDIKQSTFLEEEFQEKQFGIIKFAQEKNCPYHEGKQQLLNENDYVCVGARCIFKKNVEIERVGFEYVSKLQRNEEEE